MPRTCNKCQVMYGDEQRGLRFCPGCGDLLPVMTEDSPAPPLEPFAENTLDDYPGFIPTDNWSRSKPVHQSITLINAGPAIPDTRYLSLHSQSKSPVLAALLSFLLVGMGQIYLGQVEKGLTMLAVVLLLMATIVLGPLGFIILLLNVLDAFLLAKKIKEGKQIKKWEFFFSRDNSSA